ncbi:MAG TPA: hypothetical protein VK473_11305 [Terriglobales bacterium]|nr:hypothetical protein [Terriglobales bacterium]
MFPDINNAISAFRHPYPGESGQCNELRGPGDSGMDAGLGKEWASWEAFNLANAVRFDAAASSNNFDLSSSGFGVYSSTLTRPRVMQFSLRYSF